MQAMNCSFAPVKEPSENKSAATSQYKFMQSE